MTICEAFGFRLELFEMQEEKLCFSFCRARNKRYEFETPGAEPRGGGSSGEATGARVQPKVILFFALAGNGRAVRWLETADSVFLGEEGAHVDIMHNDSLFGAVAHVTEFFGGC